MSSVLLQPSPILVYGHPKLQGLPGIAAPVPPAYPLPTLKAHVQALADALYHTPGGQAIAATQIGLGLRIFIIKYGVDGFPPNTPANTPPCTPPNVCIITQEYAPQERYGVFINPVLRNETGFDLDPNNRPEEGCLSIPGFAGKTQRYNSFTLEFSEFDNAGELHSVVINYPTSNVSDFPRTTAFAWIVQHELDHLNSTLFIERVPGLTINTNTHLNNIKAGNYGSYTPLYATLPEPKY